MAEKCFCHLNGYAVKDSTARKEIETLKEQLNNDNHVDSEARAAALSVLNELNEHKAEEVKDVAARASLVGLENNVNGHETRLSEIETAAPILTAAIEDHADRITTLENAGSGGGGSSFVWVKKTFNELLDYVTNPNNVGKLVKIVDLQGYFPKGGIYTITNQNKLYLDHIQMQYDTEETKISIRLLRINADKTYDATSVIYKFTSSAKPSGTTYPNAFPTSVLDYYVES